MEDMYDILQRFIGMSIIKIIDYYVYFLYLLLQLQNDLFLIFTVSLIRKSKSVAKLNLEQCKNAKLSSGNSGIFRVFILVSFSSIVYFD